MMTLSSSSLDRFLVAFANEGGRNPDEAKTLAWFQNQRRFKSMLPNHPRLSEREGPFPYGDTAPVAIFRLWRENLRAVWEFTDDSRKENFMTFHLALYGANVITPSHGDTGDLAEHFNRYFRNIAERRDMRMGLKPDGFLQALRRALEVIRKMRKCANPDCKSPFFIAPRITGKFCSKMCALPAKRESKRLWWKDHGKEWRRKRKQKAKRRGRRTRKGVN